MSPVAARRQPFETAWPIPVPAWMASRFPPDQPGVSLRLTARQREDAAAVVVGPEVTQLVGDRESSPRRRRRRRADRDADPPQTDSEPPDGDLPRGAVHLERERYVRDRDLAAPDEAADAIPELLRDHPQPVPGLAYDGKLRRGPERRAGADLRDDPGGARGGMEEERPARRGNVATGRVEARSSTPASLLRLHGKGCQHRGRYSASSHRSAAATHRGGSGVDKSIALSTAGKRRKLLVALGRLRAGRTPARGRRRGSGLGLRDAALLASLLLALPVFAPAPDRT